MLMYRRHAISNGVKPYLLVCQKAKYFFKKRIQFFLVVFIGGEFAESHPLLLICQIGQISCISVVRIRTYAAAGRPATSMKPSIAWVNCESTSSAIVMTSGNSKLKSRALKFFCNVPKRVTWSIRESCTIIAEV
jgi:hypothetical protein